MKILQLGCNLIKELGGIYASSIMIRDALGGDILSIDIGSRNIDSDKIIRFNSIYNFFPYGFIGKKSKNKIYELISEYDLIIVHGYFRNHVNLAVNASQLFGIPYVIINHGGMDPIVFSKNLIIKKLWLFLIGNKYLNNANLIIVNTGREKRKLKRFTDMESSIIYWPTSYSFTNSENSIVLTKSKFLYIGRLSKFKGVLELVNLFGEFNIKGVELHIVGPDGDLTYEQLNKLISINCYKNIYLHGPLYGKDKDLIISQSDCFISLSNRENFNIAAIEAMTYGLPLLLSTGNYLADEFPHKFGFIVDLECVGDSLYEKITDFINCSHDELNSISVKNKAWVNLYCSPQIFKNSLMRVLCAKN